MATGVADFVLPAAEMAGKLIELWRNAQQINRTITDKIESVFS